VVISYRRFGATYKSHLQDSRFLTLEDGVGGGGCGGGCSGGGCVGDR